MRLPIQFMRLLFRKDIQNLDQMPVMKNVQNSSGKTFLHLYYKFVTLFVTEKQVMIHPDEFLSSAQILLFFSYLLFCNSYLVLLFLIIVHRAWLSID